MKRYKFIKSLFSPFKPFGLKFYFGKIKYGTPYFLPRRAVSDKDRPGYLKFVDKKFGFDLVDLGWKTKWDSYRFEWEPLFSFVFFGLQFVIKVQTQHPDHYWTSWLYYERETDKGLSKQDRIKQCIKNYPQIWTQNMNGQTKTINYYEHILRKKYLKFINTERERDDKLTKLGI